MTHTTANEKQQVIDLSQQKRTEPYVTDYGTISDFYLSEGIGPASNYIDWFQRLRAARESDVIRFHINCPGGDLFTTIQFMQVLSECKATIVMSIEGACMSAATLLFLMGDDFIISEHSVFLFHNYSGGVVGKGAEMYHGMVHERKWTERLLRDSYTNFLTDDEMAQLIEDKDVWMDAPTVVSRLNSFRESRLLVTNPPPEKKKTMKKKTTKKTGKKKTATKKNGKKL